MSIVKYFWLDSIRSELENTLFSQEQFYENKTLGFGKKIKNKLRTKPDLLSRRTKEQSV